MNNAEDMFPARAGMSPVAAYRWARHIYVPRASGDEPETVGKLNDLAQCSPRERG